MQNEYYPSRNDNKPLPITFNPLTHIPPSYDLYGHEIPINPNKIKYNILSEKEIQKTPWDSSNPLTQSTPMTRTKLLELRKKENIPDISYDLDGDGYVGGRDYVLSKRFDVDGDGMEFRKSRREKLAKNIAKKRKNNRCGKFRAFTGKLPETSYKFQTTKKWNLYLE